MGFVKVSFAQSIAHDNFCEYCMKSKGRVGGLVRENNRLRRVRKIVPGEKIKEELLSEPEEIVVDNFSGKKMSISAKTLIKMKKFFEAGYEIVINNDPHMHNDDMYKDFECKRIAVSSDERGRSRRIIWAVFRG